MTAHGFSNNKEKKISSYNQINDIKEVFREFGCGDFYCVSLTDNIGNNIEIIDKKIYINGEEQNA